MHWSSFRGPLQVASSPPSLCNPAITSYRELGVATGFAHDYGHGDLSLGKEAPAEVFPIILEALAAHD